MKNEEIQNKIQNSGQFKLCDPLSVSQGQRIERVTGLYESFHECEVSLTSHPNYDGGKGLGGSSYGGWEWE